MGIKSTFEKLTRSTSSTITNNDTFNYLQRQTETQYMDTEVLVKACESYAKIFNKKSKPPSNLKTQDNSKGMKRLPIELISHATLQYSQSLNENSHFKKALIEYSDSHRRIIDKQKDFSSNLGLYIVYLGENIEEYKRFNTIRSIFSKNMKSFTAYQNKLKKQNTPVTNEQSSKVKTLYESYKKSLHDLSEKMAELSSNKKEEERLNQFTNLINCEIEYYQEVTDSLKHLKDIILKNKSQETENKYSETRTVKEFVDEIMNNKLELENFSTPTENMNGAIEKYDKGNLNVINETNYGIDSYQNNNYSSNIQDQNQEYYNNYQDSSKQLQSNEDKYDYNNYDYDNGKNNYSYSYNNNNSTNNTEYNGVLNSYSNNISDKQNDIQNDKYNSYNYNEEKKEKEDKIDDYLLMNKVKDRNSIMSNNESPISPVNKNNSEVRSSIIFNKDNIILINGKDTCQKASSICDKIYNTKELDPNKCKAIYPFSKSLDDELELKADDLIVITKKFDDGWATGKNLRSNLEGFFPLNCLLEFYVTDKFAKYGGSKENSESYAYSSLSMDK